MAPRMTQTRFGPEGRGTHSGGQQSHGGLTMPMKQEGFLSQACEWLSGRGKLQVAPASNKS